MNWMSRFSLGLPPYPGPHLVGTCDVEIPVADLQEAGEISPAEIGTVAYRVYYPCEKPEGRSRPVRWVPQPQKQFVTSYGHFLGTSPSVSRFLSHLSYPFYRIKIPAERNGEIKTAATANKRWPVMMFCHGLGGSRNTYSWLLGALASHGMVVVAPDHRDGSGPIAFVRSAGAEGLAGAAEAESAKIGYRPMPHEETDEVLSFRDEQLRTRLWELTLIYESLARMNEGKHGSMRNLDPNSPTGARSDRHEVLAMFERKLDLGAGKVSWAGHSFGGATVVQLTKSVFWHQADGSYRDDPSYRPLLQLREGSLLGEQVTAESPLVMLDLWPLPLQSPHTRWLLHKPLPNYTAGAAGRRVLSIMSEAFVRLGKISQQTRDTLSAAPGGGRPRLGGARPHTFYVERSAHLSQSDFGVILSLLSTVGLKTQNPERILKLNLRAMCELVRQAGIEISAPAEQDFEVGLGPGHQRDHQAGEGSAKKEPAVRRETILDETGREDLDGWLPFDVEKEEEEEEKKKASRPGSKRSSSSGKRSEAASL